MSDDLEWARIRGEDQRHTAPEKNGTLRIALLFGGIAAALGLFLTPILDRTNDGFDAFAGKVDPFTTASTGTSPYGPKSYTIRRSVLQKNPKSKCIILSNGAASGDC